ncbi:MAG: hypothetical protein COA32_10340 [Fluviicola sp.]|nr:MAG: hypothetical protein COA32_10340 [Fluviicola sp.]
MTDKPCEIYVENGNPWNLYVIWNNANGSYIKKFNNCGSSEIVSIRKWKDDPFYIINSNESVIDTTQLKYPLSLNLEDSTWYETGINHYNYYELSFPSYDIEDKLIRDYAFQETKSDEQFFVGNKDEFDRNEKRYAFNNSTSIKKILDSLLLTIEKKEKKLRIIE